MKLHLIGAVLAALLPAVMFAAEKKSPSVLLQTGFVKASAPSCGCGTPGCAAPAAPTCAAPTCAAKPNCVTKPTCTSCAPKKRHSPCVTKPSCTASCGDNTCQVFGGPCCGSLVPSFGKWCSYLGRGVDSLMPCGRACGRPVVCNNPEVCDEVCGGGCHYNSWGGCPSRGCGALPPPGYCRQKSAFRLWPQFQCCPELAGGLTGCNTGECGGCRGGFGRKRGCDCCTYDTSATSGNGHVVTYPPGEGHTYPAAPELPNLRHQQQPTPAPQPLAPQKNQKPAPQVPPMPEAEMEPEMPPKKDDPFGDDNLPPVERDVLHLAPPARLPGRAAGSTKPAPAPRMKTARLEPVNLDIVPAVHVDESVLTELKSRPISGPRLTAPSKPTQDDGRPVNPLRK